MNESEHVEKKKNTSPPRGGPPKKILRRTFPDRLRAVKLHLEEGFTQETVAREMEISTAALGKWLARYRREGEEGLKDPRTGTARGQPRSCLKRSGTKSWNSNGRNPLAGSKGSRSSCGGFSFCPPAVRRFAKRSNKRAWWKAPVKSGAT